MGDLTLSVRVPEGLGRRLTALSTRTHRPRSYYVRTALEECLSRMEWEQDLATLAEDVRAGREPSRPLDALMSEFGTPDFTQDELDEAWKVAE